MAKRRGGSQIGNLTPDHKKSIINLIYFTANNITINIGKLSTRTTNLLQTAPRSEVYSQSYGALKSWESKLGQFRDSHLGVSGQKAIWMWAPWPATEYIIKGEGGGFLQVQVMVSLMCLCCPWLVLAPRVLQLCTNHIVWVVCRSVWVSEACQLFLVPSRSSNMVLYLSKCCELGSVPRLLPLSLFYTWTHIWVLEGVGSASLGIKALVEFDPLIGEFRWCQRRLAR
jgi:hypothetical protein